jgi:hypothetical protein
MRKSSVWGGISTLQLQCPSVPATSDGRSKLLLHLLHARHPWRAKKAARFAGGFPGVLSILIA